MFQEYQGLLSKATVLIILTRNSAMYSKVVLKVSNEVIDDVNDLFEGTATIKLT